ncbi:unnamed protein product, partial [Ectocarpus sp. 4 AP-2014]
VCPLFIPRPSVSNLSYTQTFVSLLVKQARKTKNIHLGQRRAHQPPTRVPNSAPIFSFAHLFSIKIGSRPKSGKQNWRLNDKKWVPSLARPGTHLTQIMVGSRLLGAKITTQT